MVQRLAPAIHNYSAKVKAVETITGKAKVEVKESKTSPVAKPTVFDHAADTKTVIGRLIAYPSKGYEFPASSSIPLAVYQDLPNKENVIWYFDGEEIKKGATAAVPPEKVGGVPH